jgi:thioredoxin 1
MAEPINVNDDSFETEILKSELPVLVDFWAVWCGPCRMVAPIVDEFVDEYAGKLKVCKVDVDNSQEVAANLGIRSIPTVILFKNGEEVDRIVGALAKNEFKKHIDAVLQ